MPYRPTRAARRSLQAIAARQGGYLTSRQAADAGYASSHLAYHQRMGLLERVGHGLYRLPEIPADEHDDLIRLALWSRNRAGEPQAVVSHDTALLLHELSDVLPADVHLSVPPRYRKPAPPGCVLHVARIEPGDRVAWTVFAVTTPARTLADVAASATVTREQLELAAAQALERGLATRKDLERRAADDPEGRLAGALRTTTRGRKGRR